MAEVDYSKLQFTNDYMFMTVLMKHPDICLALLCYMLPHLNIKRVEFKDVGIIASEPSVQRAMATGTAEHGVRLDAFFDDGDNAYDFEMHNGAHGEDLDLLRRVRFTHGVIDSTMLRHSPAHPRPRPHHRSTQYASNVSRPVASDLCAGDAHQIHVRPAVQPALARLSRVPASASAS